MIAIAAFVTITFGHKLSTTPPMGWMSWEVFRCHTDCAKDESMCVGEVNYKQQWVLISVKEKKVVERRNMTPFHTLHVHDLNVRTYFSNHIAHQTSNIPHLTRADALVTGGFRSAGYATISIDDCWEQKVPPRDSQGRLAPDPSRFPSGFKALADYMYGLTAHPVFS